MNGVPGGFISCDAHIVDMQILVVTNAVQRSMQNTAADIARASGKVAGLALADRRVARFLKIWRRGRDSNPPLNVNANTYRARLALKIDISSW